MKVAMVSGGGRGLGAAITRKLLDDGWTVSLGLRDVAQADAFDAPEGSLAAFPFDATDPATAAPWVAGTVDRFGRLDALINNAGILRTIDFAQGSEDDLDDMWAVNVKAPFRLIREALPHLRKTGTGRVINIASTDAKRYRAGVSVGYTMTKHALLALTQAVRFAGWEDGVRATAICPGATDTDLIANLPGVTPKAERLTPETVAGIVAFLLTLPNQASVPEFIANTRLESLI
jgi:NAD(P)-dependent dehydrogenase (short-subunit alcohol dehydrogenase family)